MKRTATILLTVFILAFPASAAGGSSLLLGVSSNDLSAPEVLGEIVFGHTSSLVARGKYAPEAWQIGAGWRDYTTGDRMSGVFIGAYVLYDRALKDTDLGVEIGYRHSLDRWLLEGSGRVYATTQTTIFNLMAGMGF